ncbi:MAG: carbohydrate binding domain-containing protein, partial [Clostridia bacterium]|nr:carbohydrate binding domain-containing protein [Clostridia bacterium]
MKKWCMWLVCMMILTVMMPVSAPVSAAVEVDRTANFVLDDFSAETLIASTNGKGTFTRVKEGAGISEGAAKIVANANYASLNYGFGARKGFTYDISAWIKVDETPLLDRVDFVIYSDGADGKTGLFNIVSAKNTGLQKDKWVKVSAVYTCDGKGKLAGAPERYDTVPAGNLQIRIGDGVLANTMASGVISYTIDDVCVIPRENVEKVVSEGNLVQNGSFEADEYLSGWYYNAKSATVTEIAGANGTASAPEITVTANWGAIYQNEVDMQFGRTYQVSYWAKATSEEAVGLEIEFILTRSSKSLLYEYIKDPDDSKLTTEWKKYEVTYRNNTCTDDNTVPNFRFRVGKGTEHLSYAVDEVEIYEVPTEGLLSSTGNLSGTLQGGYGRIFGYISATNGLVKHCVSRVLIPFESDYAILYSGTKVYNEIEITSRENIDESELIFSGIAIDYMGNVGAPFTSRHTKPMDEFYTTAEFNETVWNNDIPSLTARVSYTGNVSPGTLYTSVAYYTKERQLISVAENALAVPDTGNGALEFSVPNCASAQYAKLFLWKDNSTKPMQLAAEIEKITDARFIYIDPEKGSNNVDGGFNKPLKSLFQARTLLKREIKTATKDIYLIFMPAEYAITKTETIAATEYKDGVNVIYTSYNKNDKAEFTGGKNISGTFTLFDPEKNIYRASVGAGTQSRHLYVNGVRAVKAKNNGPLSNAVNLKQLTSDGSYLSKEAVDKLVEADSTIKYSDIGIKTSDTFLKDYKRVNDIELVFYEQWTNPRCQVASITDNGDGTITLVMDAVGWKAMCHKGGTAVTTPVYIENAIELLDEEGEWYLDSVDGYVYYKPRFFENMKTADIVLPTTEKMFVLAGASVDAPIKNIRFDNIEFTESTWMRPSTENGHSDAQNNHIRQNGDKLCDAAIEVSNAHNVDFTNCDFNRLGITALKMTGAIQNCDVVGNEFYELGGSAINLGEITGTNVVNPKEEKYFITDNNITDNYIHNFGMDFKSAAGLSVGFPKNTNVVHNEIYSGAYSGMHIGYGWASYENTGTATE